MRIRYLLCAALIVSPTFAAAQAPTAQGAASTQLATDVTAEEIAAVAATIKDSDQEIKIVDVGRENLGVAVLRRGVVKAGGPVTALNHVQLTEVYYIMSGGGTLVTGGEVTNVRPLPPDNVLVTTVVGPTNTAVFTKGAQTRLVKAGDVVVIPAGVYHGWAEVPDHVQYLSVRPDPARVLPAGYINPTVKK